MNYFTIPGIDGANIKLDKIDFTVIEVWNIKPSELYKRTRQREVVEPRQVAFYYKKRVLGHKPMNMQRATGFDHATINHSCKEIENQLQTSKDFRKKYNDFLEALN